MATSGSYDFRLTRDTIIQEALEIIGVTALGDTPIADHVTQCARSLNLIVKNLQTDGIRLWTVEEKTKTFSASSQVTGTDGNIYTCIKSHTSASGNKPITGADYTSYWLQAGSTGGAWVTATPYSNIGEFSVDADCIAVDSAFLRADSYDYAPLEIITYSEYMALDKTMTGRPTRLVYDRQLVPRVILYPIPTETDEVLHYLQVRLLEDFDSAGDNPDFPVQWDKVLAWLLASDIAFKYGVSLERIAYIDSRANDLYRKAKRSDKELTDGEFIESAY